MYPGFEAVSQQPLVSLGDTWKTKKYKLVKTISREIKTKYD